MRTRTTAQEVSIQTLTSMGFSAEQVRRLVELRERYHPFRDWCESDEQYRRISFLKWQVEQGRITPG